MKLIVVIIHKTNYYTIISEDDFIDGNEFKTQNQIVEVLQLLGFTRDDFTCDLIFK